MKLVALLAAAAIVSSASAVERPWQPSMSAALSYASHRQGVIAFAVRTPTRGIAARLLRGLGSAENVR